jgi:hypothetical protein
LLAVMSHLEASIVVQQLTLMREGRFSTWLTIQYVGNESQMCWKQFRAGHRHIYAIIKKSSQQFEGNMITSASITFWELLTNVRPSISLQKAMMSCHDYPLALSTPARGCR